MPCPDGHRSIWVGSTTNGESFPSPPPLSISPAHSTNLTNSTYALSFDWRRWCMMSAGPLIMKPTHRLGARMIRQAEDLPLSGGERRWLAYLTQHHKGRVPTVGCDRILRRKDDRIRGCCWFWRFFACRGCDGQPIGRNAAAAVCHARPKAANHLSARTRNSQGPASLHPPKEIPPSGGTAGLPGS